MSGVQWIPLGIAPGQLLKAKAGRLGLVHREDERRECTVSSVKGSERPGLSPLIFCDPAGVRAAHWSFSLWVDPSGVTENRIRVGRTCSTPAGSQKQQIWCGMYLVAIALRKGSRANASTTVAHGATEKAVRIHSVPLWLRVHSHPRRTFNDSKRSERSMRGDGMGIELSAWPASAPSPVSNSMHPYRMR